MKLEVAEILADYNYELEVQEDYSGRGMYGNSTAGLVGSMSDVFDAIGEVMVSGDEEERELVGQELKGGFRTDSMGRSIIIY